MSPANSLTHSTSLCHQNVLSSITWNQLANFPFANVYNPNMFSILYTLSSKLQLSVLEAFYIIKYQPALYKQKEFYNFLLFNPIDYTVTKPDLVSEKKNIPIPPDKQDFFFFFPLFAVFPFFFFFVVSLVNNYLYLFLFIACLSQHFLKRCDWKKRAFIFRTYKVCST